MLDPRIYRTGLVAVALAAIVFAFSLQGQPGGLGTTLAPDQFNGQSAYATMTSLARSDPFREPGSSGDASVAGQVADVLNRLKLSVTRSSFSARTGHGRRVLDNVVGTLAGASSSAIVVVTHRDSPHSPGVADLSGTAVLLELARVLSAATEKHTIVLASTSGSVGAAGAAQLARSIPGPVDAVIVLGDLASPHPGEASIIPWAYGGSLAPPTLRNTVAGALLSQAQLKSPTPGLAGQLLHLAFPMTSSEQAAFNAQGEPAVLLSLSGENPAPPLDFSSPAIRAAAQSRITALGRTVLQAVDGIDGGGGVPASSAYVIYAGKVIPAWSLRLLVLALIIPVAMTTVDGLARLRRRGFPVLGQVASVLAWGVAFLLGALTVLLAKLFGLLSGAPAGPVTGRLATPDGGGIATIVAAALVTLLAIVLLRPRLRAVAGGDRDGESAATAIGAVLVLCVATLAIWFGNPFAALLLVPALHLWPWLGDDELRMRRPIKLTLSVLGALVFVPVAFYYAVALDLSPLGVIWNGVLMIAGGQLGIVTFVLWSVVLGCLASVVVAALRAPHAEQEAPAITVRGPASYAGPGSLGGTESALRR